MEYRYRLSLHRCVDLCEFLVSAVLLIAGLLACAKVVLQKLGVVSLAQTILMWAVPAPAVALVLAGSALTEFPRDQPFWGTNSFIEMWKDIWYSSFFEINH